MFERRSVLLTLCCLIGGSSPIGDGRVAAQGPQDVPNRTKVVRLIIVPATVDPANAAAVRQFAAAQGAAKADVFIVKDKAKNTWHPMSWLGNELVDHDVAIRRDRESTVFAMVAAREQIQWESSVEFSVVSIQKKKESIGLFPAMGDGPDDPFDRRPKEAKGGPGRPIRSGPPTLRGGKAYDQLYKATFALTLEGKEVIIDPDIYCDWQ
jgi:hypothetical protein